MYFHIKKLLQVLPILSLSHWLIVKSHLITSQSHFFETNRMFVKLTLFPLGIFCAHLEMSGRRRWWPKQEPIQGSWWGYLSRPRFGLEPLCGFHVGHVSLDLFVVFEASVFPERLFQCVCHCVRHLLGVSGDVEPASALGERQKVWSTHFMMFTLSQHQNPDQCALETNHWLVFDTKKLTEKWCSD